eukprot:Gb_41404 [translate_table: standard]
MDSESNGRDGHDGINPHAVCHSGVGPPEAQGINSGLSWVVDIDDVMASLEQIDNLIHQQNLRSEQNMEGEIHVEQKPHLITAFPSENNYDMGFVYNSFEADNHDLLDLGNQIHVHPSYGDIISIEFGFFPSYAIEDQMGMNIDRPFIFNENSMSICSTAQALYISAQNADCPEAVEVFDGFLWEHFWHQ